MQSQASLDVTEQSGLIAQWVDPIARAIELAGVGVIAITVLWASAAYLRTLYLGDRTAAFTAFRANLGRGILLGLELLVGADIIATVTAPLTWTSVGLLGAIVLIRTFLSFSLEVEIEGRWPWQRRLEKAAQ